jgi:hypothetical protein
MSRLTVRFASVFIALLPLFSATPRLSHAQTDPSTTGAAPRTPRATIAYVPAAVWGRDLESAAGELNLDRNAIYWFDGTDSMGRVIGDRERYEAEDAKAAPREPLVAFSGRYSGAPTEPMAVGVAVMDTTGALIADFPHGQGFAWSPDGARLAVISPREPLPQRKGRKGKPQYRPGVTVWDRSDGSMRSYAHWPSRAAWSGPDSLFLQMPDSVVVLDVTSGKVAPTMHRAAAVSPDSRYAFWVGAGPMDARIYNEESGAPITDEVVAPLQKGDRGQIRYLFWVRGRGASHLLCGSACDSIQFEKPSCRTKVVDAESKKILASFPGEAIGPTADERGVIVFHRASRTLEFQDLRATVREHEETEIAAEAQAREEKEARAREEAEDRARAEQEAQAKAEKEAQARLDQEARAKEEQEMKVRKEQEARDRAEKNAKDRQKDETKDKQDDSAEYY